MARITCKCGNVLSNSELPNDVELRVYSDREWDKIMNVDSIAPWKIPLPKNEVWYCNECKRVYVFEDGLDIPKLIYKIEEEN